jgi:hypothetical protein
MLDPDSFIVKYNMTHFGILGKVDSNYLEGLSADSVPAVVQYVSKIKSTCSQAELAERTLTTYGALPSRDWRSTNFSATAAYNAVNSHRAMLMQFAKAYHPAPADDEDD